MAKTKSKAKAQVKADKLASAKIKRESKSAASPPSRGEAPHIYGVAPYKPKKNEPYMSEGQLKHFHQILENWKAELMQGVDRTIANLQHEDGNLPDSNDRASHEAEFGLELKTRDRERKLVRKINAALERIAQGDYGYCEETGEEIGLGRLEARPIATLCFEAQERYEKNERHYGP